MIFNCHWYSLLKSETSFQTVLLYILTQPQIYTPDPAIYSLLSQQQDALYMPYKTACGTFDLATHYSTSHNKIF